MLISPADSYAPPVPLEEEVTDLFEQLRDPLFRYLLSFGLSVPDGEEVIQEVFLALFQHLKNGKPRDNLRGWVFRVGHNLALKIRQRSRRPIDTNGKQRNRWKPGSGAAGVVQPEATAYVGGGSRAAQAGSGVSCATRRGHTISRDRGNSRRVVGNGRALPGTIAHETESRP